MGGFEVERVTQAGNVQIAEALQSQNFVTGTSGWIIRADGSYEFGPGGIFRGNLEVDGTDGSKVLIEASGGHAEIDLTPPSYNPPTLGNLPGTIAAGANGSGDQSFGTLDLRSPNPFHGGLFSTTSLLSLQSSAIDGSFGSEILVQADLIDLETKAITVKGVASYLYQQSVIFTAGGSFTKAAFPAARLARVRMVGGGGGGGGAAATTATQWSFGDGGGGGEYAEGNILTSAMAASETISIGAGGNQGVGTTIGTAGGISSFGAFITANGGAAGPNRPPTTTALLSNSGTGSPGGSGGTGGSLRMPGGIGGRGFGNSASSAGQVGGVGGTTMFSGGTVGVFNTGGFGGTGFGGGGGGGALAGSGSTVGGGNGAPGIVIVDLYG